MSFSPFASDVYVNIIRGNTTAPFFDSAWKYRIPIEINSSNSPRKSALWRLDLNFSRVLISDLGLTGKIFDSNSIRVIEWINNKSAEVPYQFVSGGSFSAASSAYGRLSWIMNGSTPNSTIRIYHVYFDITENGAKPAANYNSYYPNISLSGSKRSLYKMELRQVRIMLRYQKQQNRCLFSLQMDRI